MSYTSDEEGILLRQVFIAKGGSQPILDGVNNFYQYGIEKILSSYNIRISNDLIGNFKNAEIARPSINDINTGNQRALWPYEARRANLSYMAQLFVTFELSKVIGDQLVPIQGQSIKIYLGKIPAIIQSVACRLYGLTEEERYQHGEPEKDPGAYAIIKGQEKVLLNIENLRASEALLYEDNGNFVVRYTSQSLISTSINVISEDKNGHINITFDASRKDTNYKISINIFYIFYILGLNPNTVERTFNEIENFIIDDDPTRQIRRRREMRFYLQETIASFHNTTRGNQETIYDRFSDKTSDPDIKNSYNRNQLLMNLVWKELFSNIPLVYTNENELRLILVAKIRLLASMVAKYVDFKNGYREPDDRDAWGNKQLADTGKHLARAFNRIWDMMINNIENNIKKKKFNNVSSINALINKNFMAEQFITSYNKNMFTVGKGINQREITIVDNLDRDNIIAAISHVRRISAPTNRRAKIREKRLIHNTQWGVVCPVFTPEGESCGLTKDAAITTYISLERDKSLVKIYLDGKQMLKNAKIVFYNGANVIQSVDGSIYAMVPGTFQTAEGVIYPYKEPSYSAIPNSTHKYPLYLNGVPLGFCDSVALREYLLLLRRTGRIYFDTGIILNKDKELKVLTNGGRVCRPLLIVDKDTQELVIDINRLRGQSLDILMSNGAIEYIDVAEQEQIQILIAEDVRHLEMFKEESIIAGELYQRLLSDPNTTKIQINNSIKELERIQGRMKYTHCEIDPTAMLGISAISMPFPEYNQGPRVTYQSGMIRQALGGNSARIELRFDANMKTILEPGVPTVTTDAHEYLGLDKYPSGRELVIAITTYGGSNQEDAITFNKAAVDLGLFTMMIYHSYETTVCTTRNNFQEYIQVPNYPKNQRNKYSKLDTATGIVRLGETVMGGDCLVGKVMVSPDGNIQNDSLYVERGKEGIVDEVYMTVNAENCQLIRVRLRELRDLQSGDKLASRYSQKGTIGAILPERDIPWISSDNPYLNGVKPHVIFNPHGIPSRMTIGKLYEILVGKYTAVTAERFNATAFRRFGQPGEHGKPRRDNLDTIKNDLERMGFSRSGKEKMVNAITGIEMEVEIYIGTTYYQLLRHLVKDKMQARGAGTVQFLTRQPTSGIRKEGGLRLGKLFCLCM